MRMRHSTLAIAVNIGMVSMVSANAIPDSDNIEHVVVTATGYEQKLTQAPASISVITAEDLKARSFTSLLDAVQFQEGIDIGTTRDKTGQGSVSMRGLTGEYTLLLIDGRRQNNHGDIYPNNFGGNALPLSESKSFAGQLLLCMALTLSAVLSMSLPKNIAANGAVILPSGAACKLTTTSATTSPLTFR